MTSQDPREPYDLFYYKNNQQEYPQCHDKPEKCPPTRDPFGKDRHEAELLEFSRLNRPGQYRDYNNPNQQNPSEALYLAVNYGAGTSGYQRPKGGKN